ncbi:hypothetical protein V8E55_007000, partial [Tylopilus felleus]
LSEYFPCGHLDIVSLPFDLGTNDKLTNWPGRISTALAGLNNAYEHIVVLVANHTDCDTGDLFLGRDKVGKNLAANFLPALLTPFKQLLPGAIAYFLTCGFLVRNEQTFKMFCEGIWSLKFGHVLAFDAPHLITVLTSELLMKLTRNVVVHQIDFVVALKYLLQDISELGKYTSILHITSNAVACYSWSHRDIQPWGQHIPVQYSQCRVVQKWVGVWLESGGYSFECANSHCGWVENQKVGEPHKFTVLRPAGVKLLHKRKVTGSSWMKFLLSV